MSESDVEVKFYIDHVKVTVDKATDEVLKMLAYRIVEGTQLNIRSNDQIDTGFLINSVYPIWKDGSGYADAKAEAEQRTTGKDGRHVDHSDDMAPEPSLPGDASAGVVVGANYAIYNEVRIPFLYPAAQKAVTEEQFRGEAEQIYREVLPNEGPGAK
jgi:hypothetical protein